MYCQIAVINYDVYFVFVAAILFVLASRHGKYIRLLHLQVVRRFSSSFIYQLAQRSNISVIMGL